MPKIRKGRVLTVFQEKFIAEYLVDPNGIRAYRRARGGNIKYETARLEAIKLLANPTIRREIDAAMKAVSRYAKLKAAKVVQGLTKVALADPLDFIDRETGNLLPLEMVPPRARMAIQKIKARVISKKLEKFTDASGEEQIYEVMTEIVEIGLNDRNAALDKLMKHLGQYAQDNKQKHGIKSDAEAEAIREKLRARGVSFETATTPSVN